MFSKWKYLFYIHDSIYAIKKQIKNERRKQNLSEKNIKLVIAEKLSVAQSIAKVIGADKREDGYLEGNQIIFYPVWTDTECRKSYDTDSCVLYCERKEACGWML